MSTKNRTALTPEQVDRLRALYFATCQDPRWLAKRIDANVQAIRAFLRHTDWSERLAYARVQNRERREQAEEALCAGHYEAARVELAGRMLAVQRITDHLVDCPIEQVPRYLRLLAATRDLQAVQRLAAGMSTDRTEHDVTGDRFAELQQKLLEAMLAGAGEDDEDVPGGDPSGAPGTP